ncbi:hypothetical protein LX86_001001 [Lentzea aerocolonigenes]|nr:hypothetical protein [Lentzea aerocolonigenes]
MAVIVVVGLVPYLLPAGGEGPGPGKPDASRIDLQARYSAEQKADFVHVEVPEDLRETPSARDQVGSALVGKGASR